MIKPTWRCPCTGRYDNAAGKLDPHPPTELEPIRQEDA